MAETNAARPGPQGPSARSVVLIVFVLAACALMFELIISRMSVFYLNYANSFLAIPLTLFGLAIGSLRVHLSKKAVEEVDITRNLLWLTATSFLAFAIVFWVFSQHFTIDLRTIPAARATLFKTLAFVLIFLPPFYFIGKILTTLYSNYRAMIGRLYGFDLAGAALGCFLTPILFHFVDLPYLIFICLMAMVAVTALSLGRSRLTRAVPFAVLSLLLLPALVYLEGQYDMHQTVASQKSQEVTELAHKWNEFSRVSLLRIRGREKKDGWFRIIHDNAESNVGVRAFRPDRERAADRRSYLNLPFLLNRRTDEIMVMFAGCGKQMVQFDDAGGGAKRIVGIEINPLVRDFALETPELERMNLREFFAKPNIRLHIEEGRSFLDNDKTSYDVIYAGSNAATFKYKTGHSRKYLDTVEAFEGYLDHLKDEALLIFDCQPSFHKIESLKEIYRRRGWKDFKKHVVVMTRRGYTDHCDVLAYSTTPFKPEDVKRIRETYTDGKQRVLYAPYRPRNNREVLEVVTRPETPSLMLVTDNRPFLRTLDFAKWSPFPGMKSLKRLKFYRSWIKITTMFAVLLGLAVILALLYVLRAEMPPAGMVIYLLITGFCYMLVEITYIGKLELFLENPLYSMSLLLSIFLLTNAVGSMLYKRFQARLNMTWIPLVVGATVLVSLYLIHLMTAFRLGLPLPLKILMTIIIVAPTGVCLGLFYPFVVTWLHENGREKTVPITYGISTLSSVAGATYTMTMIINWGYNNMIYQAAVGYAVLTAFMFVYHRVRR
ncbi:MAG: hypothetical protein P9L99_15485 [Candidatus Lernaella stagnicola]|nr:hypothetical protein [Candidatus Lernaella stagnicola]